MYKNILVPIVFDHQPSEKDALAIAANLLDEGGVVTLMHVVEDIPGYVMAELPKDMSKNMVEEAKVRLDTIAKEAEGQVQTAVEVGHSSRGILTYAQKSGADCIVVSSHKPGISDYFLGSTASHIVRHAKCAVHVLR